MLRAKIVKMPVTKTLFSSYNTSFCYKTLTSKLIDAVIVTHLHPDHWDDAKKASPKEINIFAQNDEETSEIRKADFKNVEVLHEFTVFEDIQLIRT